MNLQESQYCYSTTLSHPINDPIISHQRLSCSVTIKEKHKRKMYTICHVTNLPEQRKYLRTHNSTPSNLTRQSASTCRPLEPHMHTNKTSIPYNAHQYSLYSNIRSETYISKYIDIILLNEPLHIFL